jgi:thiol-disulfide isomerase/thioredoxin
MNPLGSFRFGLLTIFALLLLLAACGNENGDSGEEGASELEHDFAFVPYQSIGNPDGETEMMFSEVFEEGKPVVLNFWAGQCPPCRAEMPYFERMANEYEDQFILLGIDVGVFTGLGTEQNALDLLEELNITYPAGRAVDREPLIDYRATGMPTTVFFNADGEVVDRHIGLILEDDFRERLDELI